LKIIKVLKNAALFLAGLLVLWLVFRNQNFDLLKSKILGASFSIILFSRVFTVIAAFIRAARWKLLIRSLGQSPSLMHTFYAIMVGYLFNLGLPRMGEFFRCWALKKTDNISIEKLLGTVVAERLTDLLILLLLVVFVFFSRFELVGSHFENYVFIPVVGKLENLISNPVQLAVVIVVCLVFLIVGFVILKKMALSKFGIKVLFMIKGFKDGLLSVWKMPQKWLFIGYTFSMWLMYLMGAFTAFFAFEETAMLQFKDAVLVLTLGGLGMTAPVQGGIGTYHGAVSQGLILLGINTEEAAAYAVLVHAAVTVFIILTGVFSLFMVWKKSKSEG